MRAFLSHSSKDKSLIDEIANRLGAANSVYDRESFEEHKRSAEEIMRGLSLSDLFVLFLSQNALASNWVQTEVAYAAEKVFSGRIKGVLIFSIDGTDYKHLPAWLQAHTVERTTSSALIVRRIRSRLIELELERGDTTDIFIGRDQELRGLQKTLTLPSDEMVSAISVAGWQGIGRRTFARRGIQMVFPYLKRVQPEIALSDNDSVEDFYRHLLDVTQGLSRTANEWAKAVADFKSRTAEQRIDAILALINQLAASKEILFIVGDLGLIQQSGDFQPHITALIKRLPRGMRPQMVLVHRRRLSLRQQLQYPNVFFTQLNSFSEEESADLLSAHLKQREIAFSREDLADLARFVGGHPENTRLAAEYAKQYGINALRHEKKDYIDILVFRSLEVIKRIQMSPLAKSICAALIDFQYLQIEDFVASMKSSDEAILEQLRVLEDHGILERLGKHYRISPYLVETIARSEVVAGHDKQRKAIGEQLLDVLSGVGEFDHVSLSLINAAALASIRGGKYGKAPNVVARFLLPSHLLTIAKEEYDRGNYQSACRLCNAALENKNQLTIDAQVEAYRLLAISHIRKGEKEPFAAALAQLGAYKGRAAKRNYNFLLGFQARYDGDTDQAEKHYRAAYSLDSKNFHVLRELAHVLSSQGRHVEAERFARDAYGIAPTNAFIIDILCEVIIGKETDEQLRSNEEIEKLLNELKAIGTAQGLSFYNERMALRYLKLGEHDKAWAHANESVAQSPRHFGPHATRIRIALQLRRFEKIKEDLDSLSGKGEAEGRANRFIVDRARIAYAIARGDLVEAKALLDKALRLPRFVREELEGQIRKLVASTANADPLLVKWSRKKPSTRMKSGQARRPQTRPPRK